MYTRFFASTKNIRYRQWTWLVSSVTYHNSLTGDAQFFDVSRARDRGSSRQRWTKSKMPLSVVALRPHRYIKNVRWSWSWWKKKSRVSFVRCFVTAIVCCSLFSVQTMIHRRRRKIVGTFFFLCRTLSHMHVWFWFDIGSLLSSSLLFFTRSTKTSWALIVVARDRLIG